MSLLQGNYPNIQASVTASGIFAGKDDVTITWQRAFVSGDTFGITLDGTLTTTTFATTSDAMLDAIANDFRAITGSVTSVDILQYGPKPRMIIYGAQTSHVLNFTLPTGTNDLLPPSTTINHSGVKELGLVIANPFDLLVAVRVAVDGSTATLQYVGNAIAGSLDAEPKWSIKRINTASGTVIEWCNGSTDNVNIWSARESLTYS